jgi:cob(I)alamin adenosyltransferase
MSIVTKTGDAGTTALMYNHRVSKCHPRVEACGAVDELNAAIGLARATVTHKFVCDHLFTTQKELVALMGELATLPEDLPRYTKDGFPLLNRDMTARLDQIVKKIEAQNVSFKDWATPGATQGGATLDVARTICRRAERAVCALAEKGDLKNPEILVYLNRLSDALWLMARWVETREQPLRGDSGTAIV